MTKACMQELALCFLIFSTLDSQAARQSGSSAQRGSAASKAKQRLWRGFLVGGDFTARLDLDRSSVWGGWFRNVSMRLLHPESGSE